MEKISHIVRGSPRISSVDVKSSGAVRPGALAFGRDIGTNTLAPEGERNLTTTATRAANMQLELNEKRHSGQSKVVEQMADQFFLSRMRRPEEPTLSQGQIRAPKELKATSVSEGEESSDGESPAADLHLAGTDVVQDQSQPSGYQPRGSYVDVRA